MQYIKLFYFSFFILFSVNIFSQSKISFSDESGFYSKGKIIAIASEFGEIYYTTNGDKPNRNSNKYSTPISLDSTIILNVSVFDDNWNLIENSKRTFICDTKHYYPVLSIITEENNLWDNKTGIYSFGENYSSNIPYYGANFWKNREIEIFIEFFETNKSIAFKQNAGLKIFGGWSRSLPQKSFAIFARNKYDSLNKFNHKIFPEKSISKYKSFVLRNSGGDWSAVLFRDALMSKLVEDMNLDVQAYRPVVVYLNGRYWGIYNLREKINKRFIQQNFGVNKDSVNLLEHKGQIVKEGTNKEYYQLLRFMENNSLKSANNFNYVSKRMDIDNYMNYSIAQIYFDNQDAGGNIKFWKSQNSYGKWRWILYDTDWGLGLHNREAYKNNTLKFATEPNGPEWPNPPWSTFILRKLLENKKFRDDFILCFADRLNNQFKPEVVSFKTELFKDMLEPEIDMHLNRWDKKSYNWDKHIQNLAIFTNNRPKYCRKHIMEMFSITDTFEVNVNVTGKGHLILNDRIKINQNWSGIYFNNNNLNFRIKPAFGWKCFSNILDGNNISTEEFSTLISNETNIETIFIKNDNSNLKGKLCFSEVYFTSKNNKLRRNFIELHNISNDTLNFNDFYLLYNAGDNHRFDTSIILLPNEFLIIGNIDSAFIKDSISFKYIYSKNEKIINNYYIYYLYDNKEMLIDSLNFEFAFQNSENKRNIDISVADVDLTNYNNNNWEIKLKPTPGYITQKEKSKNITYIITILIITILVLLFFIKRKNDK